MLSVQQYFYLFINIGALVGQIGMTYSEKVNIPLPRVEAARSLTKRMASIVRWLLACIHPPYRSLLHLPTCPLFWSQPLLANATHRVRARQGPPAIFLRRQRSLEPQSLQALATIQHRRVLGQRKAKLRPRNSGGKAGMDVI